MHVPSNGEPTLHATLSGFAVTIGPVRGRPFPVAIETLSRKARVLASTFSVAF